MADIASVNVQVDNLFKRFEARARRSAWSAHAKFCKACNVTDLSQECLDNLDEITLEIMTLQSLAVSNVMELPAIEW